MEKLNRKTTIYTKIQYFWQYKTWTENSRLFELNIATILEKAEFVWIYSHDTNKPFLVYKGIIKNIHGNSGFICIYETCNPVVTCFDYCTKLKIFYESFFNGKYFNENFIACSFFYYRHQMQKLIASGKRCLFRCCLFMP